jgi:HTH-type transcriptional regulator, transcriptional repressor of NAD biosynthesis genes
MQKPLKVVLFGPESTGKTSLAIYLSNQFNTLWCPEFARDYLSIKIWIECRADKGTISIYEDIEPIAIGQMSIEDHVASLARGVVFYDTNLLTNLIYSNYYFGRHPIWLSEVLLKRHYDLYLLLSTEPKWEYDPLRDRPEAREEIYALFKNELIQRRVNFVEISGLGQDRINRAIESVEDLLKKMNSNL